MMKGDRFYGVDPAQHGDTECLVSAVDMGDGTFLIDDVVFLDVEESDGA